MAPRVSVDTRMQNRSLALALALVAVALLGCKLFKKRSYGYDAGAYAYYTPTASASADPYATDDVDPADDVTLQNGYRLHKTGCAASKMADCNDLGIDYQEGRGVTQDYVKAADLYKKACDAKVASGCS